MCLLRRARWLPNAAKSAEWERGVAAAAAGGCTRTGGHLADVGGGFFAEDFEVYDEDYLDDEEEYMVGFKDLGFS